MGDTISDEIARLQREIADRQQRIIFLISGDASKAFTYRHVTDNPEPEAARPVCHSCGKPL